MSRLFPRHKTLRLTERDAIHSVEDCAGYRVTVILGGRLVKYLVLPWNEGLKTDAEEHAYLRHHFVRVHGTRASTWTFRWSRGLASAVEVGVLEDIAERVAKAPSSRVVSIQPDLMAAFNRQRASIPFAGAWLYLSDGTHSCVGLYARDNWLAVQTGRRNWKEMLEQERHRGYEPNPQTVIRLEAVH